MTCLPIVAVAAWANRTRASISERADDPTIRR